MKKFGYLLVSIFAFGALSACETVPYEERVAAFEGKMRADFIGKSVDTLILAFGPPQSSFPLSDGKEMLQYSMEESYTGGGDTYMSYESVITGYSTYTRPNGTTKQIPIYTQVPVTRVNPVYTVHKNCTKRFVIGPDKLVQDFKWEGNSCF